MREECFAGAVGLGYHASVEEPAPVKPGTRGVNCNNTHQHHDSARDYDFQKVTPPEPNAEVAVRRRANESGQSCVD